MALWIHFVIQQRKKQSMWEKPGASLGWFQITGGKNKHLMPLNWMQSYSSEQSKCRHLFCSLNELQLSCILTGWGDLMAQNRWNTGSQGATEKGKLNLGGRFQHTNATSLLWLLLFFVVKKKKITILPQRKTVMFHCEFPLLQPRKINNSK